MSRVAQFLKYLPLKAKHESRNNPTFILYKYNIKYHASITVQVILVINKVKLVLLQRVTAMCQGNAWSKPGKNCVDAVVVVTVEEEVVQVLGAGPNSPCGSSSSGPTGGTGDVCGELKAG